MSRPDIKRIFIAVKVEAEEALSDIISALKSGLANENIRWTHPENIHITLAFLGDTEEKKTINISSMLKEKCGGSGKFELIIKGLGVFKNLGNPRVLWTGIEFLEKLSKLHSLIINGLRSEGFILEDRYFSPHLTIGRVKYLKDKTALKELIERYQNQKIQKVTVNEVILYESILLPSGPIYKPICKVDL